MKRITFTLSEEQDKVLKQVAESMSKRPGDVAKEIVQETLDSMFYIYANEGKHVDPDVATRRMFKIAFSKMLATLNDLDKDK